MNEKGKKRFMMEVEEFVHTKLIKSPTSSYYCDYESTADYRCGKYKSGYRESRGELIDFRRPTNHKICQKMFCNALEDHSKLYIQMKDIRFDEETFSHGSDEIVDGNQFLSGDENEIITLQCSLLTSQMLDYDIMMFRAMNDSQNDGYREEAQRFYRPYLFSYVAEIDRKNYERLRKLQRIIKGESLDEKDEPSLYLWLTCTFNQNFSANAINLDGYVVQSASRIKKRKEILYILENEKPSIKEIKRILNEYSLSNSCLKDDSTFIKAIESKLGDYHLSTIDVYKIGNGNCVYAQDKNKKAGFFYDIGFNYKHRPRKIAPGMTYSYVNTMRKICAKNPSFFILSHWDMDHIAGSFAARKDFFEKDWFAPDCYDACIDAIRLAKYLDLKKHLFLAKRPPRKGAWPGRLIGKIDVKSSTVPSIILATYRLYMGNKDKCDKSRSNCEGIVIEYTDKTSGKVVLMMGDVNYASFNNARAASKDPSFANTQIDYLIAPHHGSEHTDYKKITDSGKVIKKGIKAIICCTNNDDQNVNRPNKEHRAELKRRFNGNVITTEEAPPKYNSIRIFL